MLIESELGIDQILHCIIEHAGKGQAGVLENRKTVKSYYLQIE